MMCIRYIYCIYLYYLSPKPTPHQKIELFQEVKMEIFISDITRKPHRYKNSRKFNQSHKKMSKLIDPRHNSKAEFCHRLFRCENRRKHY